MRKPKPEISPPSPPLWKEPPGPPFWPFIVAPVIVAIVVAVFACGPASVPPSGPETAYPCGLQWFECPVQPRNGPLACCPLNSICGGPDPAGFQRCEPGFCCFDGDSFGSSADAGTRHVVPMKRVQ